MRGCLDLLDPLTHTPTHAHTPSFLVAYDVQKGRKHEGGGLCTVSSAAGFQAQLNLAWSVSVGGKKRGGERGSGAVWSKYQIYQRA